MFFSILFSGSFLIFSYFLPSILEINLLSIFDFSLLERFKGISSLNLDSDDLRLLIWKNSLDLISERPILGWGAGTFPFISKNYINSNNFVQIYQHTHNILFELAYSFGIPLTFLIGSTISRMLIIGFKKIINFKQSISSKSLYKPFLTAILIFLITHMSDVTYFDGKISILFSILLAGLKNIIEKSNDSFYKKSYSK